MRKTFLSTALAFAFLATGPLHAQTPAPLIIQAVTPATATAPAPAPAAPTVIAGRKTTLQSLQEMQATNDAIIKKQEAALETLDALQKAAEEIKIYSKRG